MRTDVIVTIKGLQAFDDIDDENVELVTAGRFYHKEGKYYLHIGERAYGSREHDDDAEIRENRVTVMRVGDTQSHMVFEEGKSISRITIRVSRPSPSVSARAPYARHSTKKAGRS